MTTTWSSLSDRQKRAAAQVFGALDTLAGAAQPATGVRSLTFQQLHDAAGDPDGALTTEFRTALTRSDWAAETFTALVRRRAALYLPRAAAASTGSATERRGDGFTIKLRPSHAAANQVYVIIEVVDSAVRPQLLAIGSGSGMITAPLPEFQRGRAQLVLAADAPLIVALRDDGNEAFLI